MAPRTAFRIALASVGALAAVTVFDARHPPLGRLVQAFPAAGKTGLAGLVGLEYRPL